jgi:hypothetical protein
VRAAVRVFMGFLGFMVLAPVRGDRPPACCSVGGSCCPVGSVSQKL